MPGFEPSDLGSVYPSMCAFAFGLLVLIYDVVVPRRNPVVSTIVTGFGLGLGLVFNAKVGASAAVSTLSFGGMVAVDGYGVMINYVVFLAAFGALAIGYDYNKRVDVDVPEYNPLLLFAVSGMSLLSVANDLILLFVALELMSIATYVLCAINRGELRSVEAAIKYFILGAFSAAILLYGIAFVYGATQTTNLTAISQWLSDERSILSSPLLAVGVALMIVGFAFKVAAAPFHMWSPDVYTGAPTPVTALMATGVKAASFAAFGRVMFVGLVSSQASWTWAFWGLSALTILWGNLGALVQTDLKRMLAYSSVGHAGYLLMAFVGVHGGDLTNNPRVGGLLFYLLSYTLMTVGAFSVLTLLTRNGADDVRLERLAGLATRSPWLAAGLAVCLVSLAGIPPTMGFVGKFYLFAAAVEGGHPGLAVVGALGGAIGVYYYLRPIVTMYMKPVGEESVGTNSPALGALAVATLAILVLGVFPDAIIGWCREALLSLAG